MLNFFFRHVLKPGAMLLGQNPGFKRTTAGIGGNNHKMLAFKNHPVFNVQLFFYNITIYTRLVGLVIVVAAEYFAMYMRRHYGRGDDLIVWVDNTSPCISPVVVEYLHISQLRVPGKRVYAV